MTLNFEDVDEYSFFKESWRFVLNFGDRARRESIIVLEFMEFIQNISLRSVGKLLIIL